VVESLKSQQYYSETAFEVSATDIKDNCGANASAEAISDYLYNNIPYTNGGCCTNSKNTKSLCCDSNDANNKCECSSNLDNPQCICGNYDTGDNNEPACP
jgi:hypothetical protein